MFNKLGKSVARHPVRAVIVWFIVLVVTGLGALWGYGHGGVFDRLNNAVSLVPGTESDIVNNLASSDADGVSVTIVVNGLDLGADGQAISQFMAQHRANLSTINYVASTFDPFMMPDLPQSQALFSDKQDGFLISVKLEKGLGEDDQKVAEADLSEAVAQLQLTLRTEYPNANIRMLSTTAISDAIMNQIKVDVFRGEIVGVPMALLLLIIVFGGFLAAGLPIIGALVSIIVGMGFLWGLTFTTNVEAFTINIATIIGLSLSVDYGLLIVSRYREEIGKALSDTGYSAQNLPDKDTATTLVRDAMEATLRTAGRTVFFSALTIAVAMSSLLTMKAALLRIIGISGVAVTLLAVMTALTLVPAVIVLMRRVLIKPSVISRVPGLRTLVAAVGDSSSDQGFFSRLASGVHRRPWTIVVLIAIVLVTMAAPLRMMEIRTAFTDYMPAGIPETDAYAIIQKDYPGFKAPSIIIIADHPSEQTGELREHLKSLADVSFVSPATALINDPQRSVITLTIDIENQVGQQVTQEVKDLRTYDAGYEIMVGGSAALQYDFLQSIIDRAPLALGIMVMAVFILMFLMTGSVIVPVKAIIINSLSLLASLGATTFIFMNGYLGLPKVMGMETFILVCAVCFGFGLAMDYEVFLISRIKEYWNQGLANDESVERGLQRSGRIITSAAAIIVAVFVGFTFGDMVPIKEIGVVLAITVITDATLVRMLLVPATMTILGKWNWWSPKPLTKVYEKLHIVH
jgi:RND superfamily putative drug exporter